MFLDPVKWSPFRYSPSTKITLAHSSPGTAGVVGGHLFPQQFVVEAVVPALMSPLWGPFTTLVPLKNIYYSSMT